MAFQHSFKLKLATFFILVSHLCSTIAQSNTPTSIQNITTDGVVDLYLMYNGNSILDPMPNVILWNYFSANGPAERAFSTFDESVELIAGSAEAAGNEVVDIAATHIELSTTDYWYPASLPLGLYHIRINSTVNTTVGTQAPVIQHLSARSATLNVTSSKPIGCGPKVPAPFTNVTSPSSPDFTSVFITSPSAGKNVFEDPTLPKNGTNIAWVYRDNRNTLGAGISNVTAQFQDSTTGSAVGPVQTPLVSGISGPSPLISVDFTDVPVQVGGSYKILFSYRNNIQDGAVSPGNVVSFTTEEFNIVLFADFQNDCANVSSSGSGNSTTGSSGGSSGVSPGKSSDASKILPELKYLSSLVFGLASLSLVI